MIVKVKCTFSRDITLFFSEFRELLEVQSDFLRQWWVYEETKFFPRPENIVFKWNFLWINYEENTTYTKEETYIRDPRGLPTGSLSELPWATVSVHLGS